MQVCWQLFGCPKSRPFSRTVGHGREWEIFLEDGMEKKMSSFLSPSWNLPFCACSLEKWGASVCLRRSVKVFLKKPFHFFQHLSEVQPEAERFLFKTTEVYLPLVVDQTSLKSRSFKVFQSLILFAALGIDGDPNVSPLLPLCKQLSTEWSSVKTRACAGPCQFSFFWFLFWSRKGDFALFCGSKGKGIFFLHIWVFPQACRNSLSL